MGEKYSHLKHGFMSFKSIMYAIAVSCLESSVKKKTSSKKKTCHFMYCVFVAIICMHVICIVNESVNIIDIIKEKSPILLNLCLQTSNNKSMGNSQMSLD